MRLSEFHSIMNHWRGVFKILEQDWQTAANSIGLTMAEQHILWILHFEQEITMTEIAEIGLWDVSTVMQVIKRLKEKELVSTKKMPHDRRISYVTLTEKGSEKFEESKHFSYRFFDYLSDLENSGKEGQVFVNSLLYRQKEMNEFFYGKKFTDWVDRTTIQLEEEIAKDSPPARLK